MVKEVARGVAKMDPLTSRGAHQRPLLHPLLLLHPLAAGDPKKRPQGDNTTPEGNNSKKRRLAWMARSLIAAGVDVKFPDEE